MFFLLPQAQYNFSNAGGCFTPTIAGIYNLGSTLNASHTLTTQINVITPGAYGINLMVSSGGFIFSDTGYFTNAGIQTITLTGIGTIYELGVSVDIRSNDGSPSCTFPININNVNAGIIFQGAPATCSNVNFPTLFYADSSVTLRPINISLNVLSTGAYNISTTQVNGVSFSRSGVFTTTGIQTLLLHGTGIAQNAGTYNFALQSQGAPATSCSFPIIFN
jgi:hypothetical protein